ncbi:MAG: hypothetical protein HY974_00780, partial [Candidatus Kerfeldbacteria bacterium]|nr:hypothetical protein [Candidatus Kerfeldbacteria bacterium]
VSGTLPVGNGGSGATTLTGVLKGNGASAFTAMTGAANYVTRWSDANTIGTGSLYDSGTKVGIGTTLPAQALDITGHLIVSGTSTTTNLTIGTLAGVLKATSGAVSGSATTTDLSEGSNLYYTDTRARASQSATSPLSYNSTSGAHSLAGLSTLGTGNYLVGVNSGATAWEYKQLSGTTNQINVNHAAGAVTLSTPQDIHTAASPSFAGLAINTNTLYIASSGANVGIGTITPFGLLQVGTAATTPGLIVTGANRVGIGTTSPSYSLDVSGDIRATGTLYGSVSTTGTSALGALTVTDLTASGNTILGDNAADSLTVNAATITFPNNSLTDAFVSDTLTSSIFKGSGSTTNAIDLATAEVSGTLPVGNGGSGATTLTGVLKGNGASAFTAMTGAANYVTRWSDANTIGTGALYDNTTNIGIGTTAPLALLQVGTTPTPGLLVTVGGNVGVGTTSPGTALDVTGTMRSSNGLTVTAGTVSLPNDEIGLAEISQGTAGQLLMSNATPDTAWVSMSGDATIAGTGALTIANDAVALGTDTAGNYVSGLTEGSDIDISGTAGEGWSPTVAIESQLDNVSTISRASSNLTLQTTTSGNIILSPAGNVGIGATTVWGILQVGQSTAPSLFVASTTGNTGLGTTNPVYKLDVSGDIRATGTLYGNVISGTGAASTMSDLTLTGNLAVNGNTTLGDAAGDSVTMNASNLTLPNATSIDLKNSTVGALNIESTLMSFDTSNSRVGIGTASPGHKLDVIGYIQSANSSTDGAFYLGNSSHGLKRYSGTNIVEVYTTSGNLALMNYTSGNVGIGTTRPGAKLEISDGTNGTTFSIGTNGSLTMTTTSASGNISINPGADLNLGTAGVDNINIGRVADNTPITLRGVLIARSGLNNSTTAFQFQNTAGTTVLNVDTTNGNVGIGTATPFGLLQVGTTPSVPLLIVLNSGRVGIGTTAPSYALDVSGDIRATGTIYGGISTSGTSALGGLTVTDLTVTNTVALPNSSITDAMASDTLTASIFKGSGTSTDAVDLDTAEVTGTLTVGKGGSGATTLTGVLKGNGASAFSAMTGTATYVTRWTDANTIGTGILADTGTNVGIGTTAPYGILQVGTTPTVPLLIVLNSGNVGIGTTGPAAKLEIKGTNRLLFQPSQNATGEIPAGVGVYTAGSDFTFLGDGNGTSGKKVVIAYYNQTQWYSAFEVANVASGYGKLVLMKSGGNVGIGTTNPAQLLEISGGTAKIAGYTLPSTTGAANQILKTTDGLTVTWQADTGGSPAGGSGMVQYNNAGSFGGASLLYYDSVNNRVGIGFTAPVALLQVGTSPTPGLVVLLGGNVGIGTTNPTYKLDVNGDVNVESGGIRLASSVPGTTTYKLYNNNGTLTWNGNVLATGSSVSGTTGYISKFTTSSALGDSLIYETSSKIGIGITNPSYTLDVSGDIRATGTIYGGVSTTGTSALGGLTVTDLTVSNSISLPNNSITDAMASDTLTASIFKGSGTSTDAVD